MGLFDRLRSLLRPGTPGVQTHTLDSIEFLRTEDGDFDREVRQVMQPVLARDPEARAAYLVRVLYPDNPHEVLLVGLVLDRAEAEDLLPALAGVLQPRLAPGAFVDFAVLTPELEAAASQVAEPFYERARPS